MTDLRVLLEATFPIESRFFSLEWIPGEQDLAAVPPDADLYVVLRLITYEEHAGERLFRDVKEQDVLLLPARHRQDPRIEAWLQGTRHALLTVMRSQDPWFGSDNPRIPAGCTPVNYTLPFNLVSPDVLQLVRPRTAEDFSRALLSSKRRLGDLLFPPPEG